MSVHYKKPELTKEDFQELHRKYRNRLKAGIAAIVRNPDEAEEITSAAFATAWTERARFRAEASAYTWLYTIARNAALAHARKIRWVPIESLEAGISEPALPDSTIELLERSECRLRLREALRNIAPVHRRVLTAHVVRGISVRSIARREGIPVGTVLSRIFTAKRQLRDAWKAGT